MNNGYKILGVMLNENISCEEHIRMVETKLVTNIGLLYRAKPLLEEKSYRSKLKKIHFHQKHAVRTVFIEGKLTQSHPMLQSLNALKVYQINLYQYLAFMYKLHKNKVPLAFNELIENPFHKYPTKFSENCFSLKAIFLKPTKYCFSFRSPKIWNKVLAKEEKELQSLSIFKKVVHSKLLEGEHELEYF